MTEVEQAVKIIRDLEAKRDGLHTRARDLVEQQQELSYAAHTGDAAAEKKLEKAIAEAMVLDQKIVNIEIAIDEARNRFEDAQVGEAAAADRKQAQAALALQQEFIAVGHGIAADLTAASGKLHHYLEIVDALHRHDCAYPNNAQIRVMLIAALKTFLMCCPFYRDLTDHLPPRERKDLAALTDQWAAMFLRDINQRLSGTEHKQHEAA